jgi:RHS repeat-associated protein
MTSTIGSARSFHFAFPLLFLVRALGRGLQRVALPLLLVALVISAPMALAQTSGGVTFSSVSGPPASVTADSSGTYRGGIFGSVAATSSLDEVVLVQLREGSTVLASVDYAPDINPKTEAPINNSRSFALSANIPPGSHSLYVYAETYNGASGTSLTYPVTVGSATPVLGATYSGQSAIPTTMVVGQSYGVSLTFKNTGSSTWVAGGANPFRLGTQNPENNTNFGLNRVNLTSDVGLDEQRTFSFNVTPTQVGTFTFQWRMLSEGYTWFGDYSPAVTVTVIAPAPVPTFSQPTSNISVVASGTSATVSFAGTATASGGATMSKLELIEAGTTFATGTSSVSASKTLSIGSHTIQLKATDSRGTTAIATRTVTVTSTPPTASISSPTNGASFNLTTGTTVSVPVSASATSTSGAAISSLRLYADGVLKQTVTTSTLSTTVALAEGAHTLAIEATDSYGAISSRSSINVSVIGTAPTAALSSPTNGAKTAAPSGGTAAVSVTGTATAVGGSSITALDLLDNGVVIKSAGATPSFAATVSLAPGTHTLTLRATNAAGKQGTSPGVTVTVMTATAGLGATFISQSAPSSMRAGQPYTITVQMLNSGTTTWTPSGANPVRLGTQNPQDNRNWNVTSRAYLSGSVATGQTATFTIPVSAPSTAGSYNMQWKMVAEFLGWFGDATTNQVVSVTAGAGPSAALSATPTNVRVSGTQTVAINFTASSTASSGTTLRKLELFKGTYATDFSNTTPVATTTLSTTSSTWSPSVTVPAGAYIFKVRSTDSNNVATDSKPVVVNVTNSALLGTTSGVRTNAASSLELFGWVCQPGNATALNYKVLLDAPSPDAGGFPLTSGTANVATEPDNAAVQSTCSTPGAAHHFVVNLSTYLSQYAGRSIYVWAETADHSQSVSLPCADNGCTMPGSLRVALTTPLNGDKVSYPNPVFVRMQTTTSAVFDEVGFYVNGKWVVGQPDGTAGAYSASVSGLPVSATPYTVYAKVRQGNTTVLSVQNSFTVVGGASITLSSPTNGSSVNAGTAQALSAVVSGTAQSVKFFANGSQIAAGANSNGTWSATWTPTIAGTYSLIARAYDSAGAQIAESPAASLTVTSSSGGLTPVAVTVPHLTDADAGTLPGDLSVTPSGATSYTIPIVVPPGTAGLQPQLSLTYNSSDTNGLLGLGWKLGGMAMIHRCGKTIAQDGVNMRIAFTTSDRLCLDGQRLVLVNKALSDDNYWAEGAEYRTEIDSFSRITAVGAIGARTFKVEGKDGRILNFGAGSAAVAAIVTPYNGGSTPPAAATRQGAQAWALDSVRDRVGNFITFEYIQDQTTGEHKPAFVRYGGNGQKAHGAVEFVYEGRADAWKRYIDETRNDLRNRISKIRTYVGDDVSSSVSGTGTIKVREYTLTYEQSQTSGRSLLASIGVCARNSASTTMQCQPATVFSWGKPSKAAGFVDRGTWTGTPLLTKNNSTNGEVHDEYFAFADFENHGRTDVLEKRVTPPGRAAHSTQPATTVDGLTVGTKNSQYRYFHNTGTGFTQYTYKLDTGVAFAVLDIADFNGDGAPDIVAATDAGAKVCLSPLAAGAPASTTNPLIFTCTSAYQISTNVGNSEDHPAYLVDVVGDGRSGQYSRIEQNGIAKLCLQATCYDDYFPPAVLSASYANDGSEQYMIANYVAFTQMVDYTGIGKPYDTRFSQPHYTEYVYDADGSKVYVNRWDNLRPSISMTGFNLPTGTTAPASAPGQMATYTHATTYPSPPANVARPPYAFDKPYPGATIAADFTGSGYSGLAFGFIELGYGTTGTVTYNRSDMTICQSTGRGLDCGVRQKYSGTNYKAMVNIADFVGDGMPAILARTVTFTSDKQATKTGQLEVCRVTGDDTTNGTGTADTNMSCEVWPGVDLNLGGLSRNNDRVYFMDLLGTGRPQLIYYHGGYVNGTWQEDGRWSVYEPIDRAAAGQALDRIYRVQNGLGAVSTVEFADGLASGIVTRTGNTDLTATYPQHIALRTGKIVRALRVANGEGRVRTTTYAYADPAVDVAGRGALGFGTVTATDADTGIVTTTSYSHRWPFNGMVRSEQKRLSSNNWALSSTVNTLLAKSLAHGTFGTTVFPYVSQSTVTNKELGLNVDLNVVTTVNRYDDEYGNLTSQVVDTVGGFSGSVTFETSTTTGYKNDAVNWLIGLPETVTAKKSVPGFVSPEDGTNSTSRHTHNTYYPNGLLSSTITEEGTAQFQVQTDFIRQTGGFGLVTEQKQTWYDLQAARSATRSQFFAYDARGRYPETVTNAVGHSAVSTYDPANGVRLTLKDANLLTTSWTLDGFGRPTVEKRPDGTETRNYIKNCAGTCRRNAAVVQITEHFYGTSRIAVPTLVYSDNVGHPVSTQTFDFAGAATYADQTYNGLGQPDRLYQPAYENVTAQMASRQEFDVLGRVKKQCTLDEGAREQCTTTDYQGLKRVLTDPLTHNRTEIRDVLGQLTQVTDALAGVTTLAYEPFGNLRRTTDPSGNVSDITFDRLGHRTKLVDPDLGTITYSPDQFGRVLVQQTAEQKKRGDRTDMTYDMLDRMTSRVEKDLRSAWVYDSAANGKGQLAEAYTGLESSKDYRRIHTYDSFGRPSTVTTKLTDADYVSTPGYDAWSRLTSQTHARGTDPAKVFNLRYNAYGYLGTVERGTLVLWRAVTQDGAGRVTTAALGNGLTDTYTYSSTSARLTGTQLVNGAGAVRLQEGYAYDGIGNVKSRNQQWNSHGFIELFDYDELNRLKSSTIGSDVKTMTYFADGRIKSKTGAGSGDYVYPTPGATSVRPHAVTSIPGIGSFFYDDNGNLTSGAGRTATWTSFDMPKTITKGTVNSTFVYGPEYQRVRQDRSDGVSVIYAGAQEVEKAGTQLTVKTYWPNGIGVEIDRPGKTTSELSWTHEDRLGSPILLSDEAGNTREELAYDAWGKRRDTIANATPDSVDGKTDNKGFTGHEMLDQIDLVHMNGRVYDPLVGRFMSGDPLVQDPYNGQSYNRYSYVLNNPTDFTDPTGFACADTGAEAGCGGKGLSISGQMTSTLYENSSGSEGGVGNGRASRSTKVTPAGTNGADAKANPGATTVSANSATGGRDPKGLVSALFDTGKGVWNAGVGFVETVPNLIGGAVPGAPDYSSFLQNYRAIYDTPIFGSTIEFLTGIGTLKVLGELGAASKGVQAAEEKVITVDRGRYPESAKHIEDAQAAGHPSTVTIDRTGAAARRQQALSKTPARSGADRDEYPPAMFKEGGKGSSVRYINPSDNRGAGACIGAQCRGLSDGTRVRIEVGN